MKNVKKLLAVLLAGLMLIALVACGGKKDVVKFGVIEMPGMTDSMPAEHKQHMQNGEFVNYNNLSTALMDLESGKINQIFIETSVANYVAAHNEKITALEDTVNVDFSMLTLDSNKEVYDILNNAIKEMKADGTLDTLIENELKAYINSDPVVKDLPHFDGAKTIKIGVTGDMPPMDFVASNGKAAGFNIALLTEIANRAQVNIELVHIESGSRPMALSSAKVDAVFWTRSASCTICNTVGVEKAEGTIVTESYFTDALARITLAPTK